MHKSQLTNQDDLWYTEYVGAAAGCPLFSPGSAGIRRSQKAKEMTLDCLFFLRTSFSVKGHFCSFLLSNIIGYLAFLNLDFFAFHLFLFLIFKNLLCLTPSIEKVTFSFSLSDFGFDELLCPFDSRCLGIFSDP